jgi:hypothetical protein
MINYCDIVDCMLRDATEDSVDILNLIICDDIEEYVDYFTEKHGLPLPDEVKHQLKVYRSIYREMYYN